MAYGSDGMLLCNYVQEPAYQGIDQVIDYPEELNNLYTERDNLQTCISIKREELEQDEERLEEVLDTIARLEDEL